MAKTFSDMKTRAIALAGRTGDTTLMTATLVGDYLNKAQLEIAKSFPRLRDLRVLDKTTWDFVEDQYEYNLALAGKSSILSGNEAAFDEAGGATYATNQVTAGTVGDFATLRVGDILHADSGTNITVGYFPVLQKDSTDSILQVACGDGNGDAADLLVSWGGSVLTVLNMWYIDSTNNQQQLIKPFSGSPKTWNEDIVPRLQKTGRGLPTHFFQRGSMVELNWPPGSNEADNDLWIEYCRRPETMSADTDTSQISDIDEELVGWAMGLTFMYVPPLKMMAEGAALIQAARAQISERVRGETRRPTSTMQPYQGP